MTHKEFEREAETSKFSRNQHGLAADPFNLDAIAQDREKTVQALAYLKQVYQDQMRRTTGDRRMVPARISLSSPTLEVVWDTLVG